MGYRHYFYLVDKEEAEKVRDLSYEELIAYSKEHFPQAVEKYVYDDGEVEIYFNFHRILFQEEIHNFGKLYFCNTAERIYSKGQPLFRNKDTQKYYAEYEPFIMGKEGMLEAIECYKEKTLSYYQKLLKVFKGESLGEEVFISSIDRELNQKISLWSEKHFFNTNLNSKILTDTWLHEYEVFNLMHLYKTIDWDKKALLFYGY